MIGFTVCDVLHSRSKLGEVLFFQHKALLQKKQEIQKREFARCGSLSEMLNHEKAYAFLLEMQNFIIKKTPAWKDY